MQPGAERDYNEKESYFKKSCADPQGTETHDGPKEVYEFCDPRKVG